MQDGKKNSSKKALPLTISEIEASKSGLVRSRKKTMNLYKYPSPTKRIKSVSLLKQKVEEFFELYEVKDTMKQPTKAKKIPLPSDLAQYLGYSSYQAMANEINNPINPAYSAVLASAVDRINTNLMRLQLEVGVTAGDQRAVDSVLKRIDRINDSTVEKKPDEKTQLSININLDKVNRINAEIESSTERLMASAFKDSTDADFVEVEEINPEEESDD